MQQSSEVQEVVKFLTVDECAALLRVSRKTIYTMVEKKRIPFRRVGSRIVFLLSEILAWTGAEEPRRPREQYSVCRK